MPIVLHNNKILLHDGKIAIDLDCCCGSPSPSPGPSPWPPDEDAWCPCQDYTLPSADSLTLDNFTDDLDGTLSCGNLCFPPSYSGDIVCSYSNLNDSYEMDVYPNGVFGWYGEAILGTFPLSWTYGDPITDPGVLVRTHTNCIPPHPVQYDYIWRLRVWYTWCIGDCPARDESELYDPTRVHGRIDVAVDLQYFGYGSPNHGGTMAMYLSCDTPCTHVGICTGGTCITEDGIRISASA